MINLDLNVLKNFDFKESSSFDRTNYIKRGFLIYLMKQGVNSTMGLKFILMFSSRINYFSSAEIGVDRIVETKTSEDLILKASFETFSYKLIASDNLIQFTFSNSEIYEVFFRKGVLNNYEETVNSLLEKEVNQKHSINDINYLCECIKQIIDIHEVQLDYLQQVNQF